MEIRDAPVRELVRLCIRSREEAWNEFLRRFQPVFARIACNIAMERGSFETQEIDDLVQEICLKLTNRNSEVLRRLPDESDEAAIAYLKKSAANTVRDYFRARYADKRGHTKTVDVDTEMA